VVEDLSVVVVLEEAEHDAVVVPVDEEVPMVVLVAAEITLRIIITITFHHTEEDGDRHLITWHPLLEWNPPHHPPLWEMDKTHHHPNPARTFNKPQCVSLHPRQHVLRIT
jgi:hypothetical protein